MIFIVDEEAKKALVALSDTALKSAGVQVLSLINKISDSISDYTGPDKDVEAPVEPTIDR